jgi:hypothetical protein
MFPGKDRHSSSTQFRVFQLLITVSSLSEQIFRKNFRLPFPNVGTEPLLRIPPWRPLGPILLEGVAFPLVPHEMWYLP